MKLNRIIYILLISIFALALFPSLAYAHQIPDATGFVSDFAGVISSEEKAQLEVLIQDLREANRTEVAVVTVEYASESGESFDSAAIEYFNEQGIGVEGSDNGVLILLATEERKIGLYPGRGLEAVLPDDLCKEIIDTKAVPKLSSGNEQWGQALIAIVEEISPYIMQVEFPEAEAQIPSANAVEKDDSTSGTYCGGIIALIGVFILIIRFATIK